jgi:azurin
MEDTGNRGGIYGRAEEMFLQVGTQKFPLDGEWRYEIEQQYSADNSPIFKDASIAELFVRTYMSKPDVKAKGETQVTASAEGTTVIRLKALENEMKYDLKTFSVEAGKPVEIIFENPDHMQHNVVITMPGTMETVGRAADKLATAANGAELQYVPKIPEVLFHTNLVNPGEKVTLRFTAPSDTGDYPYVCTFPGHWSIMNGVMKVVRTKTAL